MSQESVVVRLRGVEVRFGRTVALQIDELDLQSGVTGLVGVNGAGKSTLLHLISGILRPSTGSVAVLGEGWTTSGSTSIRRRIGLAPQAFSGPGGFRVDEFVTYLGWLHGLNSTDAAAQSGRVLEQLGLSDKRGEKLRTLSGGMLRRVAIAQSLVHDPELVLLDEPTTGLDPEQRIHLRELVAHTVAGRSAVVSSHIMEDIVRIADRILILGEGRVRFYDTVDAFWSEAGRRGVPGHDAELAFLALARHAD